MISTSLERFIQPCLVINFLLIDLIAHIFPDSFSTALKTVEKDPLIESSTWL